MVGYAVSLECSQCGAAYPLDGPVGVCPCGGPLLTRYDLDKLRRDVSPDRFRQREWSMFRCREWLPVDPAEAPVTLGEGMTPLLPAPRLAAAVGVAHVWVKDEGVNPTGTFKARGAALGVTRLKQLGHRSIVIPTAGNAGGAWAAYGARAGLRTVVVMPKRAPEVNKVEVTAAGGELHLVDGTIADAAQTAARLGDQEGLYDVATLKEPFRIEGKKTMGIEIAEQLGWQLPSAIVCPTGGGVGLIAIWKAFQELQQVGWLSGPLPKMVAVQAAGCAPIVRAVEASEAASTFWHGAETVAAGLCVPKARGDRLVLRAIQESGGTAAAVTDDEIVAAMRLAFRHEGICCCPEGAAAVAAAAKLRRIGWLSPDDSVVVLNTGTGLKYPYLL